MNYLDKTFGSSHKQILPAVLRLFPQETQQIFPFTIGEMVLMGRFPHHAGFASWHWEDSQDLSIAEKAMQDLDVIHLADRLIT